MGDNWTNDDSYTDYYYDDETTVDDVLDELDLNDENSDYDISISSAPGMGTNIHVSSTKKGKNISTTKNNTPIDTISQLQ